MTRTSIKVVRHQFLYSVPKLSLMREHEREVAIIGRSNSGKSSLINALCNGKLVAKSSKTPGRTRHAVVLGFEIASLTQKHELTVVDLPGFGFAEMSKTEAQACEELVFSYLEKRTSLKQVLLLMDIRRDLDEREERIMKLMHKRGIELILILTKADKLSLAKRLPRQKQIMAQMKAKASSVIYFSTTLKRTQVSLLSLLVSALHQT